MALWTMILRKMVNNKWLQLNLLFGLTVCVALFCSMPLYSDAILQRTLLRELQQLQEREAVFPGYVGISTTVSSKTTDEKTRNQIADADQFVQSIPERLGMEARAFYQQRFTSKMRIYGADASEQEKKVLNATGGFRTLTDMEHRVLLIEGRMPVDRTDGVYEALVTERFLLSTKRELGEELIAEVMTGDRARFRVIPVGLIATDPNAEPYLPFVAEEVVDGFMIPFETFEREFVQGGKAAIAFLEWRYAMQYEQLNVEFIDQLVKADTEIRRFFQGYLGIAEVEIPATPTAASYHATKSQLAVMMLALYTPVTLMLSFYLYMVANLIIDQQKTEISVLRSRGASRTQLMTAYALEGLLLGLSALAIGPFLGVKFTQLLGASSGFLAFVQRSALEVSLSSKSYKIGAVAVGAALLLILIPAFMATRFSIVSHKQKMARGAKLSFWYKSGIDIILVGLAIYLLFNFNKRMDDLQRLALDSNTLQVDPLLFFMPAMFALGGGLLVLRVYPWFIRFLYWAGRRWWPPSLYHSLVQISRSSGQYLTIKVFLIMTVSTGLFSANAARTINDNMESKIQYAIGADITVKAKWETYESDSGGQASLAPNSKQMKYIEPPIQPMRELDGVESAAKVFRKEGAFFVETKNKSSGVMTLIGIDTFDYGKTVWMKDGLLDSHINNYLNLIAPDPMAVLVSRSIAEEHGVKPGDTIRVYWQGQTQALFTVYGIIDYWPTWNPLPSERSFGDKETEKPHLIVGHLGTIQNRMGLEPYEVWYKLKAGISSSNIYDQLAEKGIPLVSVRDAKQELTQSANAPLRMAMNGVMTLGFSVAMLICFFGFLIFWVLTLSGRTLQYGVLQAMGIPFHQVFSMLVSEQALTSGAAIIIGVYIGNLTSDLYVPLFEMSFATTEQVPPFQIVRKLGDYVQLYGIVGLTIGIGLSILVYRLSRTRISQALKLGEE